MTNSLFKGHSTATSGDRLYCFQPPDHYADTCQGWRSCFLPLPKAFCMGLDSHWAEHGSLLPFKVFLHPSLGFLHVLSWIPWHRDYQFKYTKLGLGLGIVRDLEFKPVSARSGFTILAFKCGHYLEIWSVGILLHYLTCLFGWYLASRVQWELMG